MSSVGLPNDLAEVSPLRIDLSCENVITPSLLEDAPLPCTPPRESRSPVSDAPRLLVIDGGDPVARSMGGQARKRRASEIQTPCASGIDLNNMKPDMFHLGNGLFVSVTFFSRNLKIHIREFFQKNELFYPSKRGICMSPKTWLSVRKQLPLLDVTKEDTKVLNNELLIFISDEGVLFQRMFKLKGCFQLQCSSLPLNFQQLDELRNIQHKISSSVCALTIERAIPVHIFLKTVSFNDLPEVEYKDTASIALCTGLLDAVRDSVSKNIPLVFECAGCDIGACSQFSHDCMTSLKTKFEMCERDALHLLDYAELAEKFCADYKNFLKVIDGNFFNYIMCDEFMNSVKELYILPENGIQIDY